MSPQILTDDERFARIIGVLCIIFDVEVTAERLEAYRLAMSDIPLPLLAKAAEAWIRKEKWFPKPAELHDCVAELQRQKPVSEADRLRAVQAHTEYVTRKGLMYRAAKTKRLSCPHKRLEGDEE